MAAKSAIIQENVIDLTLQNSWTNLGAHYRTAYYYKDNFGIVHLGGIITSGSVGSAGILLFSLPIGYRPGNSLIVGVFNQSSTKRCDITSG